MSADLKAHRLAVVLVHPQIAPNTGNIGRLCAATGATLHLVRPLGFVLSDRNLKRAGMDYWHELDVTIHDDLANYLAAFPDTTKWLLTSKGTRSLFDAQFSASDHLLLGSESAGLPESLTAGDPEHCIRIPQAAGQRCLNVSTAAGISLYEALRQTATS